nr:retrovirus-related Pol polyprotein from transposon TNT 1-94 [Tanacetum cinerariifolium]
MGQTNQTVHMIMPSKDNLYNGRKGIGFENPSYFKKAKDLRPTLYDEKVSSQSENQSENDFLVVEKECDKEENPKVIAPGMFKLNVSQCVSPISMSKSSCDSKNVEIKLKRKRHLDNFSSVRRAKHSSVVWKKKGSSNTSNVDLSAVFFLHSKDEASEVIISFIKKTQVNLQLQVQRVRADNGTEFKSKTLANLFDDVDITQQFSAARTPQQNGVVKRKNKTLAEAARTMLTFANLPSFLWADAITTACFTQNHSIIYKRFDNTPYELMNKRKPSIKFFCVFGCRCYLLNDYEGVGKLKANRDIRVFVGYSKESVAFRIYNIRTRKIYESVNGNFDEISEMASKQFSLEPALSNSNEREKSSNPLVLKVSEASKKDLEDLFQDFYDEYFDSSKIMKSSTTNIETSINEEVFHEVSASFQGESSSSSLNNDVQKNSIEPANMAEALKNANWVSAMQEELDQFARLKVWRLVPRPEGKSVIKTKWIFKNKKDESSLVIRNKARLVAVAVKKIFRYHKRTINLGLWYPKDFGFDLTAYSDADHAGCHLDRKSTSGSVQFLGDKLVCWSSKKQNCMSISTAESEYVAVSGCCAQGLWMRTQLTDYGLFYDKVPIFCDSKSAIAISCNPVQHTRTKHMDVRYHFIKDHIEKVTIELYFVGTEYQLADLFTKSLPEARFKSLVEKLSMMSRET